MKKIIILTMFLVTAIYFFRVVLVTDSNQDSNINNSDRKDGEFVMDTADTSVISCLKICRYQLVL